MKLLSLLMKNSTYRKCLRCGTDTLQKKLSIVDWANSGKMGHEVRKTIYRCDKCGKETNG